MERLIYHIDVNNAFLSWEALERLKEDPTSTDIRTIPSAICGDPSKRHGIILAKSPIAKQYHVSTAETIQNARKSVQTFSFFLPDILFIRNIPKDFIIYYNNIPI